MGEKWRPAVIPTRRGAFAFDRVCPRLDNVAGPVCATGVTSKAPRGRPHTPWGVLLRLCGRAAGAVIPPPTECLIRTAGRVRCTRVTTGPALAGRWHALTRRAPEK